MERARTGMSLIDLARNGRDDEASRIMCEVMGRLHAPRGGVHPDLVPLERWFEPLHRVADEHGGAFRGAAATASKLLSNQRDIVVLHGDMHHGNVLDFGDRGWLAIDPKGLLGDRGFDYANILCNPDKETATAPGRLLRQADVIAEAAGLDHQRLLEWIVAWAGLSAEIGRAHV
jgi:streptomycin 6-kinase